MTKDARHPSSYHFLQQLLETPSPSGFESRAQQLWIDYVHPFADEVTTDAYGNAFAFLYPRQKKASSAKVTLIKDAPKLLLGGHIDELGLMVTHISEEGFLYFKGIGGIDRALVRGQRVIIHTEKGPIPGVTGSLAIHLQEPEDRKKVPEIHEMYIDVGLSSRKEVEKLISVGDPITYSAGFQELAGGRFAARGCDNRIGAWAVAEALRQVASILKGTSAKASNKTAAKAISSLETTIVATSTIQEENGLYGASMAGYSINPTAALIVDVTHATDTPNSSAPKHGSISLGKGPVLSFGSSNHPLVNQRLRSVAKKESIPTQLEANPCYTGTDADAIFLQRGGIPTVSIGVPNRYMHSPVEMIEYRDLERTAELLAAFSLSMKEKENFHPTFRKVTQAS